MSEIERRGTGRSAAGLAIIAALVVALIALAAWVLTRPGFLDELANVLVVAAVAIAIVLVVAYIAYAVLALAEYAYKGDIVQKGVDHSIDDVRGVEGRTLDDDRNDIDRKND